MMKKTRIKPRKNQHLMKKIRAKPRRSSTYRITDFMMMMVITQLIFSEPLKSRQQRRVRLQPLLSLQLPHP